MIDIAPPIVVVAYNRPKSLGRILNSLSKAFYPGSGVDLIVSIDKAPNNQDVLQIAKDFNWTNGDKKVSYQEKNLGLKKHILQCGSLSRKFGSVIVLEDDLYVSPNFYTYACEALKFSLNKPYIGGISLYNHKLNVHSRDNFSAINDGFDNWYFQFASSWGQAWTKDQWTSFETWFNENQNLKPNRNIPNNVLSWSDKSWLKHFIVYLVEKNRYFLYPKISLSTNFSDVGTHMGKDSTIYQVALDFSKNKRYHFSELEESDSIYDAFFENEGLCKHLQLNKNEVCIDLYGIKHKADHRFWLTTKVVDYSISRSFGRSLKPIDANIIETIQGDEIFLYDTAEVAKNKFKYDLIRKLNYNIKNISFSNSLRMSIYHILRKIKIRK